MDTTPDETIKNILYIARCCKEWGLLLKQWNVNNIAQKLLEVAITKFCLRYSDFPDTIVGQRMNALFEAIVIAVEYECTVLLPDILVPQNIGTIAAELSVTMLTVLPHLSSQEMKEKMLEYLLIQAESPLSGLLSNFPSYVPIEWLFDQKISSPAVYKSLQCQSALHATSDLLKKFIISFQDEHVETFLILFECRQSVSCETLAKCAVENSKPQIASIIMCKLKSEKCYGFLNKVVRQFDDKLMATFVLKCSPKMRRDLIKIVLFSNEDFKKRKDIINIVLKSGPIETNDPIDFVDVLRQSMEFLLFDPNILETLFKIGFSFGKSSKGLTKLILKKRDQLKRRISILCILLENKVNIDDLSIAYSSNQPEKPGTPLHAAIELAIETGNTHIVSLVCKLQNDNSSVCDAFGASPLHFIAKQSLNNFTVEICRIICTETSINPLLKDNKGKTALDYCCGPNDERVQILNEAEKSYDVVNTSLPMLDTVHSLVQSPENVHGHENSIEIVAQVCTTSEHNTSDAVATRDTTIHLESVQKSFSLEDLPDLHNLLDYILSQDILYFSFKKRLHLSFSDHNDQEEENTVLDDRDTEVPETNKAIADQYDVFYSPLAKKFLQSANKLVPKTLKIIERLACGESPHNLSKKLVGPKESIYEAKLDEAKRILWCKVIAYSPSKKCHCRVIIILDIVLDHNKISKAAQNADKWIQQGRIEGGTYSVKLTAKGCKGSPSYYELIPENLEDPKAKEVPYMMRDEYGAVPMYSLPEYVLKSIHQMPKEGIKRFGLPLRPSHEEHEIIDLLIEENNIVNMSYHVKTLLVVGRSGTGKTTCCLMRLWEEFLHYWEIVNDHKHPIIPQVIITSKVHQEMDHSEEAKPSTQPGGAIEEPVLLHDKCSRDSGVATIALEEIVPITESSNELCNHIHQVFVTKNPYLTQEVKRRFYDFVSGHDKLQDHLSYESKPLPLSLKDVDELHYPLFITSRELLILIDGTLDGEKFFRRKQDGKLVDKIYNSELPFDDIEFGDVTFEDVDDEDEDDDYDSDYNENIERGDEHHDDTGYQMIEVTSSYFKKVIWPVISKGDDKAKSIDPILVWQEIKSFIKGSVQALKSEGGYLSLVDYKKVGKSKAPNFFEWREIIYDLFLKYHKYCHSPVQSGERLFDEGDLLFNLHNRLENGPAFPWVVHNFYIDEVQDFTEAELYLLLSCSQCPNGNFLCGDSAQSIMRGVSFRFTDVRSLFHELKTNMKVAINIPNEPYYLTINYRAHAGILRVSDSVIELLGHFFKESFDAISEKSRTCYGDNVQKPLIVYYDDPEQLPYILSGHQHKMREIEFGAHQAIIVPSEEVKKKLPKSLQGAIVLTVLEAKGLEFNDVLLFNFFSGSNVSPKSWELVNAYTFVEIMNSSEKIRKKYEHNLQRFNESENKELNTELKYLYTAITRAKRNLWICDQGGSSSTDQIHPMYNFWLTQSLVKEVTLEDSGESFQSTASTPEDWKKAGDYLLAKHLWEQAEKCYRKANSDARVNEVHAYVELGKKNYKDAARYFLIADKCEHERRLLTKTAVCLKAGKLYSESAQLFEKLGRIKQASDAYLHAKDAENFIRVCELKQMYSRVINGLRFCGYKIKALEKAVEYGDKLNLRGFQINKFAYECVKHYTTSGDRDAVKVAVNHLDDSFLKIKYLGLNGFYEDILPIQVELKNYEDAFLLVFHHGFYRRGIEIAGECGKRKQLFQFLLCQIYAQLKQEEFTDDITNTLTFMQNNCSDFPFILAQTFLLQGKLHHDTAACLKAKELFEKSLHEELKVESGLLETVNTLFEIGGYEMSPNEVLDYCLIAVRLSKAFAKTSQNLTDNENSQISQCFHLNQIQKLINGLYLLPPYQAYWLKHPSFKLSTKLTEKELYIHCEKHFSQYCTEWLESSGAISKTLSKFILHKQVLQQGLIPWNARNRFTHYLETLSIIVELNESLGCYPESRAILVNLFSPLSVIHNHAWKKHHLLSLQNLTAINNMLKMECTSMLQNPATVVSLDELMKMWRLCLIAYNNTKALYERLSSSFQSPHFVTGINSRNPRHIFYYWIRSCDGIAFEGSVLKAIEMVYKKMLTSVAFSEEVRDTISDDNLLYIVIVQSTALLYLASLAWKKMFFIPKIFKHVIFTFDLLNNQGKSFSLIKACVEEAQQNKIDLSRLGRYALHLLQQILNFLLGQLNSDCNILDRAVNNENEIVSMYYIVLILTATANLYIARPNMENEPVHKCLVLLQTKMDSLQRHTRKPNYANYVYSTLSSISHVPQLFVMSRTLLERVKNSEMCQIFPSHDLNYLNVQQLDDVRILPNIPLKPVQVDYSLFKMSQIVLKKKKEGEQEGKVERGGHLEKEGQGEEDKKDENEGHARGREAEDEPQGGGHEEEEEEEEEETVVYPPQINEGNDILVKLKENKIENNFCWICKVSISSKISGKAETQTAQGDFERQDSSNESEYDNHINSSEHKEKRDQYERFKKREQICSNLKWKAVNLIEDLKKLPSLSPDDDSLITACEIQLTTLHQEVDSIVTSGFTWLKMSIKLTYQCQKFNEVFQKLRGITSSQDEREETFDLPEMEDFTEEEYAYIDEILPDTKLRKKQRNKNK